jgi:transposase-like protein
MGIRKSKQVYRVCLMDILTAKCPYCEETQKVEMNIQRSHKNVTCKTCKKKYKVNSDEAD